MSTEKRNNPIETKSYSFAIDIVELYKRLSSEKKEFILSKQLLRSGTSIGANIQEGLGGYSKKDFSAKLGISYKECQESKYWLRLLKDTDFITIQEFKPLFAKCDELAKMLFSIIKSSKNN